MDNEKKWESYRIKHMAYLKRTHISQTQHSIQLKAQDFIFP